MTKPVGDVSEPAVVAAANRYMDAYRGYQRAAAELDAALIGVRSTASRHAFEHPGPWSVEVLGRWVRVVDAEGADVVTVGDVHVAGVWNLAERIAASRA